MTSQSQPCFLSGFAKRLFAPKFLLILYSFALFISCSKKEDSNPDTSYPGMLPGECRISLMDDTLVVSYDDQNRVSRVGRLNYSYLANEVRLSDPTNFMGRYDFSLDAKGYPINVAYWRPGDTVATLVTWFNYNPDSTLGLSRSFVWQNDHYAYSGKIVYIWVNRNLREAAFYGKDSSHVDFVNNYVYDLNKLDNRSENFAKMFNYSPVYSVGFMPKSVSKNLLLEFQITHAGSSAQYYGVEYLFDASGKITLEKISKKGTQQLSQTSFKYECSN